MQRLLYGSQKLTVSFSTDSNLLRGKDGQVVVLITFKMLMTISEDLHSKVRAVVEERTPLAVPAIKAYADGFQDSPLQRTDIANHSAALVMVVMVCLICISSIHFNATACYAMNLHILSPIMPNSFHALYTNS